MEKCYWGEYWETHLSFSSLLSWTGSQGVSVPYIHCWQPLLYILTLQECVSTSEAPNYWPLLHEFPSSPILFLMCSVLFISLLAPVALNSFFLHCFSTIFSSFVHRSFCFLISFICSFKSKPLIWKKSPLLISTSSRYPSSPPLIFILCLSKADSQLTDWLILSHHFTLNGSLFCLHDLHQSHSEWHFHTYKPSVSSCMGKGSIKHMQILH